MKRRELRSPEQRVGRVGNAALPPPTSDTAPSIETVLRRALIHGDEAALERVVHRLRPEMLRLAARHVRSIDDAEDVVQDTWIAALAAIDRFEGRASLKTWLFRILTYRARSAARHRGRFVPISRLTDGTPVFDHAWAQEPAMTSPEPDPEETFLGLDLRRRIEAALPELPGRQRQVVRLRDLEGWSPQEVCSRLRLSPVNQRVLLHRGRLQLRQKVAH
ncbi:MAG: RNA polymerase sigma factor [Longimicrobiales bacterium]